VFKRIQEGSRWFKMVQGGSRGFNIEASETDEGLVSSYSQKTPVTKTKKGQT
jgi:hypothetical protein